MKALSQNKQTIYYKLLDGVSDVEIGGLKTGEKQKISLGDDFLESYVSTVTEQMDLEF